jgi:hypothetical protein
MRQSLGAGIEGASLLRGRCSGIWFAGFALGILSLLPKVLHQQLDCFTIALTGGQLQPALDIRNIDA